MRVLHLVRTMNPRAGDAVHVMHDLCEAARLLGHRFEVASSDDPIEPFAMNATVPLHPLGPAVGGYARHAGAWLTRHAAGFDALVLHGPFGHLAWLARRAARQTGVPYFMLPHGSLARPGAGWTLGDRMHARVHRLAATPLCAGATAVLFSSAEEARRAAHPTDSPPENAHVTGAGVAAPPAHDCGDEAPEVRWPELRARRIALFDAPLTYGSGADMLLDALADSTVHTDAHLVIAGSDPDLLGPRLTARAASRGLAGRITLAGALHGAVRWSLVRHAELFVVPARHAHFDVRAAEALACGTPVLVTSGVDMGSAIERHGAGWVEPPDSAGLANGLRRWLALSPADVIRARIAARQCWAREYAIESVATRLLQALEAGIIRSRAAASQARWIAA